jgi:hypothetical protein
MSEEAFAIGFHYGRLQLMLGNEVGITAAEIIAIGDQTRLDLEDLPGTRLRIQAIGDPAWLQEALLLYSDTGTAADELANDVEICGMEGAPVPPEMHSLDTNYRKAILAEAALAAWRQRLSDAADSLGPLTTADAEIVGRLGIPGSPLITELRADRRRASNTTSDVTSRTDDDVETVVGDIATDLRAAVRFGAAGLADATDTLLPESIGLACEQGGWVDRLKLLIAAEEICAIGLLATCSTDILRANASSARPELSDQLLARYTLECQRTEELSSLLDEVIGRLPSAPRNPATRFLRRKAIDDVRRLRQSVEAYSSVVRTPSSPVGPTTTWTAATQSLIALERATGGDSADPDSRPSDESKRSVDEAAVLLGELFADRLPAARALVDDVTRQHPGVEAESRIQIIKRQAVRKLSADTPHTVLGQSILEIVAELAMSIALLRGFDLRNDAEFQELGRRLLARAERIAKLQAQAGNAIPIAANGFSVFAQRIQPLIAEYVFHSLGGVKPSQPGAARNVYKTARSKVWRARHDRDIADAAAGGASEALQRAIDAGAPRLIVRYVDRSMRAPRSG